MAIDGASIDGLPVPRTSSLIHKKCLPQSQTLEGQQVVVVSQVIVIAVALESALCTIKGTSVSGIHGCV